MELLIKPTVKQALVWQKLFDQETHYIMFGGGAGGGKTWLICDWLVYMCLKFPGTKWFIAREELKRIMGSTYITLIKVLKERGVPNDVWTLNGQYNYVQFGNGSRIDLLDVKALPGDPLYERFGSMEFTGGAMEEIGEISQLAFDVLKTRIGRHANKEYSIPSKILLTCNPKKNWAYYLFYKPWKEKTLEKDKCFIQSLYKDNPYTADDYGRNLASISDPIMKQRLMFGEWEYDDDPSKLFEYDNILNMFTNSYVEKAKDLVYIVADIARFGSDRTIVTVWRGLYVAAAYVWTKKDIEYTKKAIDEIARKFSVPRSQIVIDEDGVGGGVVDGLKGVKGFVNNSRPYVKEKVAERQPIIHNYGNLKAQCYLAFAEAVNSNKVGIYKDIPAEWREWIVEEMEQIKRKDPDKDGKIYITPKEEIKEQLGRSPDFADALMMRFYFEVLVTGYRPAYTR